MGERQSSIAIELLFHGAAFVLMLAAILLLFLIPIIHPCLVLVVTIW